MNMMERTRFLGRTAVLAATFATLLAAGTAGVAEAAQTPTAYIPCSPAVLRPPGQSRALPSHTASTNRAPARHACPAPHKTPRPT